MRASMMVLAVTPVKPRDARERLRIEADEIDGGHYVTLSRPRELAGRLDAYASRLSDLTGPGDG